MKISSIIAAGIAVVGAKKPKFSKSNFQDAKERGITVEEEAMFEKCGGRPELPANGIDLDCLIVRDKNSIVCVLVCPDGWRPDRQNWSYCR